MARYWIGPWEWATQDGESYWRMPAGGLASLDLRSPVQCAQAIAPIGRGIFVTPNATTLAGYRNLGTNLDATLTEPNKRLWESELGLPGTLAANQLRGAIFETLTLQSDPTGQDRALPLMPTTGRQIEMSLGGLRTSRAFDGGDAFAVPIIDLLRRQYRSIRQQCLDGELPPLHYRKMLGYWVRKYGLPYRRMQPADLPDEPDLPPETTISDDFTRADGDTIGNTLTWTEIAGDVDTATNKAEAQTLGDQSLIRADSDLSSSDHYAEGVFGNLVATSSVTQQAVGPILRKDSSATQTYYHGRYADREVGSRFYQLYKVAAGTLTQIGSSVTAASHTTVTLRAEINGSTLKFYVSGVEQLSETDTAIASGTRCGARFSQGASAAKSTLDDFEAADLAVAGDAVPQVWAQYRRRHAG